MACRAPQQRIWQRELGAELKLLTLANYMAINPSHIQTVATGRTSLKCPLAINCASPPPAPCTRFLMEFHWLLRLRYSRRRALHQGLELGYL